MGESAREVENLIYSYAERIATALLSGATPPPGALDRIGSLAPAYVVAAFEPAAGSDPRILREIHTRAATADGVLTVSDTSGWTALIPVAVGDDDSRPHRGRSRI